MIVATADMNFGRRDLTILACSMPSMRQHRKFVSILLSTASTPSDGEFLIRFVIALSSKPEYLGVLSRIQPRCQGEIVLRQNQKPRFLNHPTLRKVRLQKQRGMTPASTYFVATRSLIVPPKIKKSQK